MSPKLQLLAKRMKLPPMGEQAPAPETSGLGAAIEQLIQRKVDAAVEEQQLHSPKVERLLNQMNKPAPTTDFKQLPPLQRTAPIKNFDMTIHRDAANRILWAQCGNVKFEAVRDGAGCLIGTRQIHESPVLPALDIPFKVEAREYDPGTPRKIYGNNPE